MNVFYCRWAGDLLGESAGGALQQKRRAYALADAKPHFAPDRPCDIVHIALTLQLDIAQQSLQGTCATTVRAVQEAVSWLDAGRGGPADRPGTAGRRGHITVRL